MLALVFAISGFGVGALISLLPVPRAARSGFMIAAVIGTFIFLITYPKPGLGRCGVGHHPRMWLGRAFSRFRPRTGHPLSRAIHARGGKTR